MLNSPALGLSVGATNLAGRRDGLTAVVRPAEVDLQGIRLTGFVDRVGDPVPLVAPDGSTHRSDELLATALAAMTESVTRGMPVADMAVTVPAHWRPSEVEALRKNLRTGTPVVSDATAAITALRTNPGLPSHGVIALCDFGGSGTSITLADAAADYARIGHTVRFPEFSGDQIDQALLTHVFGGIAGAGAADPSGTAMVGSLGRLRDECRRAKERLSAETATAVVAELPSHRGDIRVNRAELEDLIEGPMADFLAAVDDTLERYGVTPADISAVATVGGGARIPFVTQRLSEHLRAPVVTTAHPQLTAAEGAALIAHRSRVADERTVFTPLPVIPAATEAITAGPPSTTFSALAWSEDDAVEDVATHADSRPELSFHHEPWRDEAPARRAPIVLFGLSAAAAAIAAAVFGLTLLSDTTTTPVEAASTSATSTTSPAPAAPAPPSTPPAPQATQVTTVVVQQPARRSYPAPQQPRTQTPVTQQPTTTTTTDPTPTTTTPASTSEKPTTTDPTPPSSEPTSPKPPPIDPGPGDGGAPTGSGGTGTGTPPIDPGTGGSGTGTGATTAPKTS